MPFSPWIGGMARTRLGLSAGRKRSISLLSLVHGLARRTDRQFVVLVLQPGVPIVYKTSTPPA